MKKNNSKETAEKVTNLSLSLFNTAVQIVNIITALQLVLDNIRVSADLFTPLIKELPPEVQKQLAATKVEKVDLSGLSDNLVEIIERILKIKK